VRSRRQRAAVRVDLPRARLRANVAVTPGGLLAIGGMVAMILLGSAAIVVAARRPISPGSTPTA
jgi:hypothetical protein